MAGKCISCARGDLRENLEGFFFFNLLLPVPSQLFLAFGFGHEPLEDALGMWQNGSVCLGTKGFCDVLNLCCPAVVSLMADSLIKRKREKKTDLKGYFVAK